MAKEIKDHQSVGWRAKGVKYSKEDINDLEKKANNYLNEAKLALQKPNVDNKELQEINIGIDKAKNRLKDYEDFKKNNYTFFPIKITVFAAFDDGSSDPYDSYCITDFDLNNKKQFTYKIDGNLDMVKHDKNKIVLEASNEDFEFSLSGFGTDSEEKNIDSPCTQRYLTMAQTTLEVFDETRITYRGKNPDLKISCTKEDEKGIEIHVIVNLQRHEFDNNCDVFFQTYDNRGAAMEPLNMGKNKGFKCRRR